LLLIYFSHDSFLTPEKTNKKKKKIEKEKKKKNQLVITLSSNLGQ